MSHICETCAKVFAQKSGLTSHLKNKRPCKPLAGIERLIDQKVQSAVAAAAVASAISAVAPVAPSAAPSAATPLLKWVGGKTQIIQTVLAHFPPVIHDYHEPFLGGGSVLLAFLSSVKSGRFTLTGSVFASDLNASLIGFYKTVKCNPEALITEAQSLATKFASIKGTVINRKPTTITDASTSPESFFYWIRSQFNAMTPSVRTTTPQGAAMLLFLNKTCFRGVYREGPHGFNVPFGHYTNPGIVDPGQIRAVSALLCEFNVVFTARGFRDSLAEVCNAGFDSSGPKDWIYADPPYAPETDKSFVGYTSSGFNDDDHTTLFKTLRTLNVQFLMSNADVPLVRDAFPSPTFTTTIVNCRRAINSKKPDARTNEVLIKFTNNVIALHP